LWEEDDVIVGMVVVVIIISSSSSSSSILSNTCKEKDGYGPKMMSASNSCGKGCLWPSEIFCNSNWEFSKLMIDDEWSVMR
jgi:hypothetical protein